MKMVKSLLLGSAAGLVAIAGAQAADLPVKAKPVQYVKICSLYGAGYYYIPGTDTCLKLGGWVRAEYNVNSGGSFNPIKVGTFNRNSADNAIRVRGILTLDFRTQTEYGTLRSYIAGGFQHTSAAANDYAAPGVYSPRAFIQFAGFTAGLAQSFYDFYSTPAYSNTTNVWGADTGGGGDMVFAYTATFGGGLSASLSLEDPTNRRTIINQGAAGSANKYSSGPELPDLAANLRYDSTWGSAQVMGALHQVNATYYGATAGTGHPEDEVGYAVGAGLKINLPMLGKGDSISTEVNYSKGALKYLGSGIGNFAITQGSKTGIGNAYDAVYGAAGGLELTTGWSIVAGAEHRWTDKWKTSLYGTYGAIDYSDAATAILGTDQDFKFSQVGSRTVFSPAKNLDLSVDVMYNKLESGNKAAGNQDMDWWQAIFRWQSNFYP